MSLPSSREAAITLASLIQNYLRISATALLTYDYLITMENEIRYFWGFKPKTVTWIFLLNRYVGLFAAYVDAHTIISLFYESASGTKVVAFGGWTHQIAGWLGIMLIDSILLMRVAVLCLGDQKTVRILKVLFVIECLATLGLLVHVEIPLTNSNYENASFDRLSATFYWIIPLAFELTLLAVAIAKTATYWQVPDGLIRSRLHYVLLRDQVIYFIIVIACSIASIAVYWIDAGLYRGSVSGFANASLPCLLGSHLLFNLKEVAERDSYGHSDNGTVVISDIRFI